MTNVCAIDLGLNNIVAITNKGKKINEDINRSLNMLRKYINKSSPNQEIAMDNGREQRPIKKRVA